MIIKHSLFTIPLIILTTACSSRYSVSSSHGVHHGYRNHVSVGISTHSHSATGMVLGALVVGGVIGHMIAESSDDKQGERRTVVRSEPTDDTDSVANGYEISGQTKPKPVESRWYQVGQDGKCYLMESINGEGQVVSVVPDYSCN